jgi:hypothetical protein
MVTDPTTLVPARLELHWAAQVLAAAADAWLAPRPDDSHTAMTWDVTHYALVGAQTDAGVALALRPERFEIVVLRDELVGDGYALAGRTLAEAMAWADRELAAAARSAPRGIAARTYDMPAHPVGTSGAPFRADRAQLAELARWYSRGHAALVAVAADAPLRVWPHHFDLGAVIHVTVGAELALGLSPGDSAYAEPYFYVTPYPVPSAPQLPALAGGGHWHTSGFTGAVLTATALGDRDPHAFLTSAITGARGLISAALSAR